MKLHPMPTYKMWIYTVNILMLILMALYIFKLANLFNQDYIKYFSISPYDNLLIVNYVLICLQITACLCGILGVFLASRDLLRLFWFILTPLLAIDIIFAILLTTKFSLLHTTYKSYLTQTINTDIIIDSINKTSGVCEAWGDFQIQNSCCLNEKVRKVCFSGDSKYDTLIMKSFRHCGRSLNSKPKCYEFLLRWLHSHVDFLAAIYFFTIYPVKLIIVIALREDIAQLFGEIIYSKNRQLYKHWANEFDEDTESLTHTNRTNEYSSSATASIITTKSDPTQIVSKI